MEGADTRVWAQTDLPGEWVTGARPLAGLEVFSARGSTRHWSEPLHDTFTVAAVRPAAGVAGAKWQTRGQSLMTTGGQLMNINAGDGHTTSCVPAPSAFDVVKLSPAWLEQAALPLSGPRARAGTSFRFASPTCDNALVFAAVGRLVGALAAGDTALAVEASAHELAYALVTELDEAGRARGAEAVARDPRLRRVCDRLVDHPSERPSLDALEADTGLAKSQLCALFRKEYGISIGQYWTGCRIAKAKTLLLAGLPAKHVAVDLGFTDEPYFARMFKRHQGQSPAAWVRLYRGKPARANLTPRACRAADASA